MINLIAGIALGIVMGAGITLMCQYFINQPTKRKPTKTHK